MNTPTTGKRLPPGHLVVRCPDCACTGRVIQTALSMCHKCPTCHRVGVGCVEVVLQGSAMSDLTHVLIVDTDECLCGRRLPAADRTGPGSLQCTDCQEALAGLLPTTWELVQWGVSRCRP